MTAWAIYIAIKACHHHNAVYSITFFPARQIISRRKMSLKLASTSKPGA